MHLKSSIAQSVRDFFQVTTARFAEKLAEKECRSLHRALMSPRTRWVWLFVFHRRIPAFFLAFHPPVLLASFYPAQLGQVAADTKDGRIYACHAVMRVYTFAPLRIQFKPQLLLHNCKPSTSTWISTFKLILMSISPGDNAFQIVWISMITSTFTFR